MTSDTQIKDRTKGDHMTQTERWETEHIDINGNLSVPVERSLDPAPKREGWEPFWANTNLDRSPQKNVKYRRVEDATN